MKYRIYQPKEINFLFNDKKATYKIDDYKKVYEGDIEAGENHIATLEDLFRIFNIEHPEDFKGHSLSVNDIVVLESEDGFSFQAGEYICADFGWKKIKLV